MIAEFERVAVQLNNIMEGHEALENAPVKHETMVQDIKRGDVVMCPARPSQCQTVKDVDDFFCYFIITFDGDMGQEYFDRGETLMVCEAKPATQINDVSTLSIPSNEALSMTTNPSARLTVMNAISSGVNFNNTHKAIAFASLLEKLIDDHIRGESFEETNDRLTALYNLATGGTVTHDFNDLLAQLHA